MCNTLARGASALPGQMGTKPTSRSGLMLLCLVVAVGAESCGTNNDKRLPDQSGSASMQGRQESEDLGDELGGENSQEVGDAPTPVLDEEYPYEIIDATLKVPFQYQLDAKKLGQERGAFGDKEDAPDKWTYSYTIPSTDILFPVGSSDRRYYINTNSYELIFESKSKAGIQLWWRVRTVPVGAGDSVEARADAHGTLEQIMAGHGRRFDSGLPAVIAEDLKRRRAFAWYKLDSITSSVHCGFITAEGDFIGFSSEYWYGDTAYPISKEERSELGKMKN